MKFHRAEAGWLDALTTNQKIIFIQSILALVLVWEIGARFFGVLAVVSSPTLVMSETIDLLSSGEWFVHTFATAKKTTISFALSAFLGSVLGMLMGLSTFVETAFEDYVTVGLSLPGIILVLIPAMFFGPSIDATIMAGVLATFPFITLNVLKGFKDIDPNLVRMSKSFDVPRLRTVRRVVIMSVLPGWLAGARYTLVISLKVVTLSEAIVSADRGIGGMLRVNQIHFSMTGILAWTLAAVFLILIVEYGVFKTLEKHLFKWRPGTEMGLIQQ